MVHLREPFDHNKVLQNVAKEILRPAGLVQKGRSRFWFADHGWWTVNVELQPSGYDRGTYLNVGAMWLVYPAKHFAFHDGYRVESFAEARRPDQFEAAVRDMCTKAVAKVREHEARIRNFADAYRRTEELLKATETRHYSATFWELYFPAVFAGLVGDVMRSRELAAQIEASEDLYEWQQAGKKIAAQTLGAADLARKVEEHVSASRVALGLVRDN